MKTLREMMDLVESAQMEEPVDEGIRNALAGAALAGSMAMSPNAQAQTQDIPSWQSQVEAAVQAGDIPRSNNIKLTREAGWVTSVTVDGRTYDVSHRIPQQEKQLIDKLSDLRSRMQR
jgi:hypothetical protein